MGAAGCGTGAGCTYAEIGCADAIVCFERGLLTAKTMTGRTDCRIYQMWGPSLLSRSDDIAPSAISDSQESYLAMTRGIEAARFDAKLVWDSRTIDLEFGVASESRSVAAATQLCHGHSLKQREL